MVAAVEPFDFIASITSAYSRLGPIYYFSTNSALIGAAFVMGSLPSPSDGDQDRASALLAVYWVPFPFTFALICARIFVRCRTRSLGLDDYTMVLAWILFTISNALASVAILHGGARHIYYLSPDQLAFVFKYIYISSRFTSGAAAIGKCSVAFLLLRIMGPQTLWQKWFIYVNVAIYLAIAFVSLVIQIVQCAPTRALWETVIGSRCWPDDIAGNMNIFQSSYGTYMDFAVALLPITIIRNLNMSFKSKIWLCVLLGLGVIAGIFTAIKTANLHHLIAREDFTWANFLEKTWAEAEIALVIICGCIPTIKPLFDRIFKGKPLRPSRSPYLSKRSYRVHSNTNASGRTKFSGHTGNLTNVTSTACPSNHPADGDFSPQGIHVERGVDVVLSDWDSGMDLVGENTAV